MRAARASIALVVLMLAAPARPLQAATKWLHAESPHFELYSSSDRDSVARLATALESMADILSRAGLGQRTTARPVTVVIGFPDRRSFEPHLPVSHGRRADLAGYVIHTPFGNWIGYAEYDERGRMVAQHEYVHTIVNQVFRHLPVALNEGFAEYLSTFRADDAMAEFGHPIPWHRYAIQSLSLLPLDRMFALDEAKVASLHGDDQAIFYAEAWALVHYLLRKDATGGRFTQFMRAAADGEPVRTAFVRYYPDETWDQIPSRLKGYVETEVYTVHQIPLGERGASSGSIAPRVASTGEVLSEIGLWRLYNSGVDTMATRQVFQDALLQGPDDGVARAGLGELMRMQERKEPALALYRDVARNDHAAPRALTLAGAGMMQTGLSGSGPMDAQLLTEAQGILARSVTGDSTDAAALGWFGRAAVLAGGADDAAVSALGKAAAANPGDEALASAYSMALAQVGHTGEALDVAERSRALNRNQDVRQATMDLLQRASIRDSVMALIRAGRSGEALAVVDELIATTKDDADRAELRSVRAEIAGAVAGDSAVIEYNTGVTASREGRLLDAREHFISARRLAADDEHRALAERAIAHLDSMTAEQHARDVFQRGVRAWKEGDYRGAKARFDSTRTLATTPTLRSAAADASSDAGAILEIERGIEAARRGAWSDAVAAFQHAARTAKAAEIKSRAERLLADANKSMGAAGGKPGQH